MYFYHVKHFVLLVRHPWRTSKERVMDKIHIPNELRKMNSIFKAAGFDAYLVGGAVRDILLKKQASDWDIATNAHPDDVSRIFRKVIPTGIAHGTVTVHFMGKQIEVTTFRADQGYSDGRHPDRIFFADSIEDDLSRRDFTMNAIAASLDDGSIIDPYNGQKDIKAGIIRTVGNPHDRFMEDGLRPVRAIRFASQLSFSIDRDTYLQISDPIVMKKISSISRERFRDELLKIIRSPLPSTGLFLMEKTGILRIFIPELAEGRGVTQTDARGFHQFDVLDHNIYSCDGAPQDNCIVRLAALLHDVGKVRARSVTQEDDPEHPGEKVELIHFWKHEIYSEEIARQILTRLKFSNLETEKICHLIREHMFFFQPEWKDSAVRRLIVRVGKDNFDDLFALRLADNYGKSRQKASPDSPVVQNLMELKARIEKIEEAHNALSLKDLSVNGNELIKAGIKPGRRLGLILNELFQTVLDDPGMNQKDRLLEIAKRLSCKYGE